MKTLVLRTAIVAGILIGCLDQASATGSRLPEVQEILSMAKLTGICDIMDRMALFQEATQMPGGNAFVGRFLNTELARLGWSHDKFFRNCEGSASFYKRMYETEMIRYD